MSDLVQNILDFDPNRAPFYDIQKTRVFRYLRKIHDKTINVLFKTINIISSVLIFNYNKYSILHSVIPYYSKVQVFKSKNYSRIIYEPRRQFLHIFDPLPHLSWAREKVKKISKNFTYISIKSLFKKIFKTIFSKISQIFFKFL